MRVLKRRRSPATFWFVRRTLPRGQTGAPLLRRRRTTTSGFSPTACFCTLGETTLPIILCSRVGRFWAPESPAAGPGGPTEDMALLAGSLLGPTSRSAALLGGRWLQPRAWLGFPDAWGLPTPQQARGKTRGNEYQPSNIKRKNKHGWVRRLSTPAGVQVILRRMLKGRKSLSH
ncbi:39S ribosomal protein L34, mitochondrial isoform X1 [Macaca thibetana thibetana]|uniref:39S ribosomal protein L34, mitochondrial isoform X1 n=1 Tax=Macaca thibetana thibetana TaxID=257877 RepID=UPI0003AB8B0C|nr:39S ribosomal protein L34, mitochondrial [Macaca fascicularis]XP_050625801.1 39S ribosomal protein L34, mitochondrial isoform X1 [Macaca thibetana thibetana]